jgi:hypothetical protein
MFPLPQNKYTKAWYAEQRHVAEPPYSYYDAKYLHTSNHANG